jgi:hypothetical protein
VGDFVFEAAQNRFRLKAHDFDESLQSGEWDRVMGRQVNIRRAWGMLGLFWALLIDELEARRPFPICKRCGWIMQGRQDKRFYGPNDNKCCHLKRGAERQRKSRTNNRSG